MSSVAVATLGRETPRGPDPYRRTLAQLSTAGAAVTSRGAGLDPLLVLAVVALVTGATAILRHGLVAVDARHVAAPALPQLPPVVGRPALATVSPPRRAVRLRVGETREFAVDAAGDELHYRWTVDEEPAGSGAAWTYAPGPEQIGRRRVAVAVMGPGGAIRQSWTVRVRPPEPPRIAGAFPAKARVESVAGDEKRLRLTWTVDGRPAGKQESLTLRPNEPGTIVVRAVVASNLGAAASREWRINVVPAAIPAPAAAPAAAPPAGASPPKPVASTPEHEPLASVAPAPPGPDEQGVRSFLERYAAAWRAHDVDTLRRLGQVTTDEQARTLREYFAKVQDLDVEVHLVEVRADGERTVVSFTRRDRFRDPPGRGIPKESPPTARTLVTTPEGFRFANAGG